MTIGGSSTREGLGWDCAGLDFGGRVGVVKEGLDLKKVILLGRTFEEYCHYFGLTPGERRWSALSAYTGTSALQTLSTWCSWTAGERNRTNDHGGELLGASNEKG
jgi:hypothetical protein